MRTRVRTTDVMQAVCVPVAYVSCARVAYFVYVRVRVRGACGVASRVLRGGCGRGRVRVVARVVCGMARVACCV